MRNILVLVAMVLLMLTKANAEVRIEGINFEKNKDFVKVIINYKGNLAEIPSIQYKEDTVQLTVPNGVVWPQITKMVALTNGARDTKLLAYQYDKKTARIRAILPFKTNAIENKVQLDVLENKMILNIPVKRAVQAIAAATLKPKKKLDENYLNKLLDEKKIKKSFNNWGKKTPVKQDIVKTSLAGLEKDLPSESKSSFSVMGYAGKFVAFLGLVLLLFYGVVNLLRKGVTKKGRLSFLGNTNQVEVISTTFISPKKSILLVKAHKQVFLVSNTEQGMSFLSEIKDAAGFFKDEERDIAGTNFDTNLETAQVDNGLESKVKLKEDSLSLSDFINSDHRPTKKRAKKHTKDKVKFSDQIKKKVKDLKPLQ
jgi:flagellar biogenesis protein FliO